MLTYVQNRLAEHATQVALSADFAALIAALSGQITWQAFGTAMAGSLVAILFPSRSAAP